MDLFIDYTEGTQSSGDLSNYYTKSQTLSLVTEADKLNIAKIELSLGFKQAFNTAHKEFIKSGKQLVAINIYNDSGKSTKLFSKTFSSAFLEVAAGADAKQCLDAASKQIDEHILRHNFFRD